MKERNLQSMKKVSIIISAVAITPIVSILIGTLPYRVANWIGFWDESGTVLVIATLSFTFIGIIVGLGLSYVLFRVSILSEQHLDI